MSIDACLDRAVRAKEISKAEADELKTLYARHVLRRRAAGDPVAEVGAKADLSAELRAEAAEQKRRAALQAAAVKRVAAAAYGYRTAGGREDVAEGAIALLEHYGTSAQTSVEGYRKALVGMAHARLADLLTTFERTALSGRTPNPARLDNVVREAFGEATGDAAARGLASAWLDTADWLRSLYNRAGGAIGKLENWGMPQRHNAQALVAAGKASWKAAIKPMLDLARMRHPASGTPVTADELDGLLEDIWREIVTDGWATRDPAQTPLGRGSLASRRAEHRFLIFRNADSWLAYQRDFGEGNPFAAMMGHVNMMARDVAAMHVLGPNPEGTLNLLKQTITKEAQLAAAGEASRFAGTGRGAISRANRKIKTLEAMWATMRGASETPVSTAAASLFAGMRNWVTASVMGSAIVSSATTDPVYQMIARRMAGLPAASALSDIARGFSADRKAAAIRAGLILDSAMHTFGTQARYIGTLTGDAFTRYLSDRVLTYSGLTPWTQAGRHAFGLEFTAALADHAGRGFDELPPAFAKTLDRYGLGADWDTIRSAALYEPETGSTFLRPHEIAAVDEDLALRVLAMIQQETEYAVPSGTVRGRASFIGIEQPGTLWGEIKRSAGMFKSFGITFALLYGGRIWREGAASKAAGAAYGGAVLTTTTLGGMLAVWLKDVVAGRDPRPIFDEDGSPLAFMGAALLQGGGFGIWGDFLFADLNRFGGGIATTLGGPLAERGTQLLNLTIGNLVQLAAGDETNALEELRQFLGSNVPGSSLWYLRLAYQRVLLDQLEAAIDPQANQQFKRRQTFWRKGYGTDFWWKPGAIAPERLPDVGIRGLGI